MASGRRKRRVVAILAAALVVVVAAGSTWWWLVRCRRPLVVAVAHDAGLQDAAGSAWAERVESLCGCDVEWRDITSDSVEDRYVDDLTSYTRPELSGIDEPDVFIGWDRIAGRDHTFGVSGGLLEDLGRHIADMPNVQEYFSEVPEAYVVAREDDGSVRSIPGDAGREYDGSMAHLFINRAWLEALELPVPDTWDEFTETLHAFRDRDPNGNGSADEIPLLLRPPYDASMNEARRIPDGWRLFLNAVGIPTQLNEAPGDAGFMVERGTVSSYVRSDGLRHVAAWLTGLASEGLTARGSFADAYAYKLNQDRLSQTVQQGGDPDEPTLDGKDVDPDGIIDDARYHELLAQGMPVVGVAFAFDASAFGLNADDYEAIPMPAMFEDMEVTWDFSARARFNLDGVAVRADTRRLDDALAVVNALFDETVSLRQYYGADGVRITHGDGTTTVRVTDPDAVDGYGRSFVGWIRPGIRIIGDAARDRYAEADAPYKPMYTRMGGDGVFPPAINAGTDGDGYVISAQYGSLHDCDRQLAGQMYQAAPGYDADGAWRKFIDERYAGAGARGLVDDTNLWQQRYDLYRDWTDVDRGASITEP